MKEQGLVNFLKDQKDLEALIEAVSFSSMLSIFDGEGHLIFANELFCQSMGIPFSECHHFKIYDFLSSCDGGDAFVPVWDKIKSLEVFRGPLCFQTQFEERLWLQTTAIPMYYDRTNDERKYILVQHDVTDLRFQQEENWKQLQFQASINSATNNAIIRMDLDGTITYVNTVFEKLVGKTFDDVVGILKPVDFIKAEELEHKNQELNLQFGLDHPASFHTLIYRTQLGIKNESDWTFYKNNQNDAEQILEARVMKCTFAHIYDQENRPTGYSMVGVDVTQSKKLESYLVKAKNEAENSLRLKNDLLSRLSHELKTPLNGVFGMLEMFDQSELTSEQKDYLDSIKKSSNRLLSLVNKTIEFETVESEQFDKSEKSFSVAELFLSLENQYSEACQKKKLNLILENKIEHQNYKGDLKRIMQVMQYFMENAIKFTDHGSITLQVKKESEKLYFEVRDTGRGISKDLSPHIFKPFVFEKNNRDEHFEGLGFSLAIAQKIIDKLQGQIGFKSSLGHGSFFWISLPLEESAEVMELHRLQRKIKKDDLTALIVEDDEINQRLIKKMLNKMDIYPECVSNGMEAIELLKEKKFNLILMDINMPLMDGLKTTEVIRENPVLYGVPVIVAITANAVVGDEDQCLKTGMDFYLSKPITMRRFEDLVLKIVDYGYEVQKVEAEKSDVKFYMQKVLNDFKEDEDILNHYISQVLIQAPKRMKALEEAILTCEYRQIETIAHQLKDLMSNFHLEEMRKMLEMIESQGKKHKLINTLSIYADLKVKMKEFIVDLDLYFIQKAS